MKTSRCFLLAFACVGLLSAAATAVTEAPQIARVMIQQEPAPGSGTFVNNLQSRRLNKFITDDGMVSLRCDVELKSAALPPGAEIIFEYRLPKATESRSFSMSGDRVSPDSRTATFFLPVPAGVDGAALAWRARIVREDVVLAERKSTLWR